MDKAKIASAFNEWMRRYIEDPKAFDAEFQSVGEFQAAKNDGREPSYGETCAAYLQKLVDEA